MWSESQHTQFMGNVLVSTSGSAEGAQVVSPFPLSPAVSEIRGGPVGLLLKDILRYWMTLS